MKKKCETCDFYNIADNTCHRFPPQFGVIKGYYMAEKLFTFPKVKSYDWCGEHKEKEK